MRGDEREAHRNGWPLAVASAYPGRLSATALDLGPGYVPYAGPGESLFNLLVRGVALKAVCMSPGCGHKADIGFKTIVSRFGESPDLPLGDLADRVKCAGCGGASGGLHTFRDPENPGASGMAHDAANNQAAYAPELRARLASGELQQLRPT